MTETACSRRAGVKWMRHALIIEDRALIAAMIEDELVEYGFQYVRAAATEREAIRMAEQHRPDIITADDRLASGSGISAVRHICRDGPLPVVFITADSDRIRRQIPDAVIVEKPFTHAELGAAISLAVAAARAFGSF